MTNTDSACETDIQWYVVQLRPNCAQIAERNLRRQNFGVFSPRCRVKRHRAGRCRETVSLLFPGYVFVSFEKQEPRWQKINATYGVSKLVTMSTAGPRAMPMGLVEEIKMRCDSEGLLRSPDELKPGDRVRVSSGPFAETVSKIESLDSEERVWILLDIMGRMTRVAVSNTDLLKLAEVD